MEFAIAIWASHRIALLVRSESVVISETQIVRDVTQAKGFLDQFSPSDQVALLQGDVLLTPQTSASGGAVTAHIYVPLARPQIWPQVTNYSRRRLGPARSLGLVPHLLPEATLTINRQAICPGTEAKSVEKTLDHGPYLAIGPGVWSCCLTGLTNLQLYAR